MAADCAADNYTECVDMCELGIEEVPCGDLYEELLACVGTLPPDGFFCTNDGESAMLQASCTIEQQQVSWCLSSIYDASYFADASAGWSCSEATSTENRTCYCTYTVIPADVDAAGTCDPALGCCNTVEMGGTTTCACSDRTEAECDQWISGLGEYSTRVPSCPAE